MGIAKGVSIDQGCDVRRCMVIGCGKRAIYRNPTSASTSNTQRGYCSAHREMARPSAGAIETHVNWSADRG
jgi:hypothetical protein